MNPSLIAYIFINNYADILDESVESFLKQMYTSKIQNRYAQEIVAMLNDAGIETADEQWRLFIDKFDSENNRFPSVQFEVSLDSILNGMINWFGLTYSDIKFWILDDPDYSKEWEENDQGEIIRK